jgi:D-alanine-D-alanine ligase
MIGMRIGLSFDLKEHVESSGRLLPDDAFEEYDYPATVDFIASALAEQGHSIIKLGGGREFLNSILAQQVDIVFNISEGRGTWRSREAQVPSVLEMLGIHYSGSDPESLSICLDKPLTKQLVSAAGVPTPAWSVIRDHAQAESFNWAALSYPMIAKPAFEGSSKGVRTNSVAAGPKQAEQITGELLTMYRQPVMLEGFVRGDEITVGILGNSTPKIVGIMRIVPKIQTQNFVYSLEVKRDWRAQVDYECPANISSKTLDEITEYSIKSFQVLECRDFARIDFRIGADGIPYFIEINPLPGLGDYSDLILMAIKMGWSQNSLIQAVMNAAIMRCSICAQK